MQLTHVPLIVKNQDEALKFFVEKLGFEKKDDSPMGKDRWLTVCCKGQPIEIVLQMPHWGPEKASIQERTAMIGKQSFCFSSPDIAQDHKKLLSKGVKILGQPTIEPWGKQLLFEDLYGNVYVLVGK